MKNIKLFITVLFAGLCFVSCDKNIGAIEEVSEKFVMAINDKDKATVYELYEVAKKYDCLKYVETLNADGMSVEKNDSTGLYEVMLNEERGQRLVFEADSAGNVKLIDSYGVMKLDSAHNELAINTGVPQKKISDIGLAKMFEPGSLYMKYLEQLPAFKSNVNLFPSDNYYAWRTGANSYVKLNFTVQNWGQNAVSGEDYALEISIYQKSTGNIVSNKKTLDGKDLAPRETREFTVNVNELLRYAVNKDLRYNVSVKFRSDSQVSLMLKYAKFTGKEYENFAGKEDYWDLKLNVDSTIEQVVKAEKTGHTVSYAQPDEKSAVVDTLYHQESIQALFLSEENEGWCKVGHYKNDTLTFSGYVKRDEVDYTGPALYFDNLTVGVEEGIKVYAKADNNSNVLKTLPVNSKYIIATSSGDYEEYVRYYERNQQGFLHVVGYILQSDIDEFWGL